MGAAAATWVAIAICAVLNGILREAILIPHLGEHWARPLSAAILLVVVYLLAWALLRWRGPMPLGTAWTIGSIWLVLTVAFEIVLGRLQGLTGREILATYNPFAPTLWDVVLLGTLIAPPVMSRLMQ